MGCRCRQREKVKYEITYPDGSTKTVDNEGAAKIAVARAPGASYAPAKT